MRPTDLRLRSLSTLRSQALALLAIAVAVAAVGAYALFRPIFERTLDQELSKRGRTLVSVLAQHRDLRLALSLRDGARAGAVAESVRGGDMDVRYLLLLDADGNVLGASASLLLDPELRRQLVDAHQRGGEGLEGTLRFTREVEAEEAEEGSDGLDFATEGAGARRRLGTILLGLSADAARRTLSAQTLATVLLTAAAVAVAFLTFFNRLRRRLQRLGTFAAEVAAGNLTAPVGETGQDEIGQLAASLATMASRSADVVQRLQEAASSLARASSEILVSATQQGEAATRQAASVSETGATVHELRQAFGEAAERAEHVIALARQSEDSTSGGRAAVQEAVAAMEQIRDQVVAISRTMASLVDRTRQIGGIIDTVNDLAEQSNVLALNAAIEAARAGEHGRGFAVVAREVRSLAQRSKDATAQVLQILEDIDRAGKEALGVIDEGTRRTQAGVELANRAGQSILALDAAIHASSSAAQQIAASTRQQAVGVEQIWQAVKEIDRAASETASGIRHLEEASRNMKSLSEQMAGLITAYRVGRAA